MLQSSRKIRYGVIIMARKKNTSWYGGGEIKVPTGDAATTTAGVLQLIPAIQTGTVDQPRSEVMIEAIYAHFSIRRSGAAATSFIDALGFLVYQSEVTEGSNQPVQALDALSLVDRAYSNKRIMMMAPLPVPPLLGTSDLLAFQVNDAVLVAHHEFQANRKHNRSNTVLCMTLNCDVDLALRVFVQWRVLVTW